MTDQRNCLLYARLSLARTDENGMEDDGNVQNQLKLARAHAERMGWHVAGEYVDNSVSAAGKKDRAGFNSLIAAMENGEGDVVVSRSLDRISRNRRDTERFFSVAEDKGVLISLYVGGESFNMKSSSGRLLADIMSSVARAENSTKSERSKEAHVRRREEGKPWGPYRIFGLNDDGSLNESEAELVRKAIDDVMDGASIRSIMESWDKAGITTTRGGRWRQSTFSNFIRNPRIAGLMPDGVTPIKNHSAIIDPRVFAGLQVYLSDPSRSFGHQQRNGRGRSERLLAGVAVDPEGRTVGTGKSSNGGYTVYRTRVIDDRSAPGKITRKAETCDEEIINEVLSLISSPMMNIVEGQSAQDREKLAEVHGQLAELAQERQELAEAGLSVAAYGAMSKAQDKRELELKGKLGEVKRSGRYADLNLEQMPYSRNKETLRAWWDGLSVQEQRAELDRWFESITILPGRGRGTHSVIRQSILDEARRQGLM